MKLRLGAPLDKADRDPQQWIAALQAAGYSAAYAPVGPEADDATAAAYVKAAEEAGIIIAEVGAWSNPIDPDPEKAKAALEHCKQALDHAERLGARCCVNIAGSRNPNRWDGPHPDNLSRDTFDLIVETTREIIDAVKPKRTAYTLEPMPWIYPSSPENYLELIHAIDRKATGAHLDPVNMINRPELAYDTAGFLKHCFALLGPHIRSVHAKDIILRETLTVHLDECRPGLGVLDYAVFIRESAKLPDTPFLLEHLPAEEYGPAAAHVRSVASSVGAEV